MTHWEGTLVDHGKRSVDDRDLVGGSDKLVLLYGEVMKPIGDLLSRNGGHSNEEGSPRGEKMSEAHVLEIR